MKCIDVSEHQGYLSVDDWKKIKKVAPYCMIRSSYTRLANPFRLKVDAHFKTNIVNAYKAGMIIGIYHFSQGLSSSEGIAEANFCLKTIKPYKKYITLPVTHDYELNSKGRYNTKSAKKLGKSGTLKVIDGFCNVVKNAGYEPMVYTCLNEFNNYISNTVSTKYKIWVAQYANSCDYKYKHFMWQYTSKAKVPGVSFETSGVDMNYIYIKNKSKSGKTAYIGTWPVLPERGWFQKGDRGGHIKNLQKLLNWLLDANLDVDGQYGDLTRGAVCKFQRQQKLTVDGEWGKNCQTAAKKVKK